MMWILKVTQNHAWMLHMLSVQRVISDAPFYQPESLLEGWLMETRSSSRTLIVTVRYSSTSFYHSTVVFRKND